MNTIGTFKTADPLDICPADGRSNHAKRTLEPGSTRQYTECPACGAEFRYNVDTKRIVDIFKHGEEDYLSGLFE